MSLPLLAVSVIPDRDHVRVLAAGELDLSTAEALGAQLDDLFAVGWPRVTVDLREIDFMDSAGLHVLLRDRSGPDDSDGRLTVVVEPGPVRTLLQLAGIDGGLDVIEHDGAGR
jgi:anti-sigma B factor antagonist